MAKETSADWFKDSLSQSCGVTGNLTSSLDDDLPHRGLLACKLVSTIGCQHRDQEAGWYSKIKGTKLH